MSAIVTTKAASREKSGGATLHGEIGQLLRQYRYQVGFTYCLLLGENSLRLLQPLLLGIAVNDLLQNSQQGLWWFVAGHAGMMSVQYTRQLYDTRVFSRMYAHRASGLVQQQRHQAVETSRIVARASLSRQFISFIEQQVPSLVTALFSCLGGILMLACYQTSLLFACLLLAAPVALLNIFFARSLRQVSCELHDRWEDEVHLIESGSDADIHRHYQGLAKCWIRMSDLEARTTGLTELMILSLMAWALVSVCRIPDILPGDIFAVFRYLMMFVVGIDSLPRLVEQVARLRDISRRL